MQIRELEVKDLHKVANWLSQMNEQDHHYAAWLASDPNEIFEQIWTLTQFNDPLAFIAWDQEEIAGFLGLLPFFEQRLCRLLGPFALKDEQATIERLWDQASLTVQLHFDFVKVACFEENKELISFAEHHNFQLYNIEKTLGIHRNNFDPSQFTENPAIVAIKEDDYARIDHLHPAAAYYTTDEMMKLSGEPLNHLWGYQISGEIVGYIYFETIIPGHEGEICFVQVAENERGRGIGSALVKHALHHAFQVHNLNGVTISVRTQNKQAELLYQQIGFKEINRILAYQKEIEKPQPIKTLDL